MNEIEFRGSFQLYRGPESLKRNQLPKRPRWICWLARHYHSLPDDLILMKELT